MKLPSQPKPVIPTAAPELDAEAELEDERLDAELEQSFPASDPLPWHHDVRPVASPAADAKGKKT
jgi:hypothetical protein